MPPAIPADTDCEATAFQLGLLRRAGPTRRLALALSLSRSVVELARAGLRRRRPAATDEEIALRLAELQYGPELAAGLRDRLARRSP